MIKGAAKNKAGIVVGITSWLATHEKGQIPRVQVSCDSARTELGNLADEQPLQCSCPTLVPPRSFGAGQATRSPELH
jgi:hypothetical protein